MNNCVTECDKEPIHLLSNIKPHGFLLVIDKTDLTIIQISNNIEKLFNTNLTNILNQNLRFFIDSSYINNIIKIINDTTLLNSFITVINHKKFFCTIHCDQNIAILEFEEQLHLSQQYGLEYIVNKMLENCNLQLSLEELLNRVTATVQEISGFDRVMIYKFDELHNGTVIAQVTHKMHDNFLGHHFPSSDIPAQARELYLKNRFRIIENVDAIPISIIPTVNPITNQVLDMTFCHLRSVSSMHIEYLKNMGVISSMSISIIINNNLWGLIACHDFKPNIIPMEHYRIYDIISKLISTQIGQKELIENFEKKIEIKLKRELFLKKFVDTANNNFAEIIENNIQQLSSIIDCDACMFVSQDKIIVANNIFVSKQLTTILKIVQNHMNDGIYISSNIGNEFAELSKYRKKIGGIIATKCVNLESTFIIFIRLEQIYTIKWAGNIPKKIDYKDGKAIVTPRNSFESWKEIVKGTSQKFVDFEIDNVIELSKNLSFIQHQYLQNEQSQKLVKLNEKLNIQANTDPLTLLYNQRYFKDFGVLYFQENKGKKEFSLVLVDIDNLKSIKEQYGNEICDLILISLTNNTKKQLPKKSVFARVGCEEFAILLCESNFKNTIKTANKIKQEILDSYILVAGNTKVSPQISMGIAQYNVTIKNFSELVRAAEIKLSIAQESGGDIISF